MVNFILKKKQKKFSEYEIQFDKKALSSLNKLDIETKRRIWAKLSECKKEPFRYLKHLSNIEGYKMRVGNYRLIIDVQDKIKVLFVLKVGHRKNVYEN